NDEQLKQKKIEEYERRRAGKLGLINSSSGNKPLFNGPSEALKLSESDLHRITVRIHRKISASSVENTAINRAVVNPEEIKLKRRTGEGAKPIFDREELKPAEVEVEERRIVEYFCAYYKHKSKDVKAAY
ncbi:uncharacterized protein LOC131666774, partial [Phymastichus coffea]|uniref:uncharacterized protein LOC131666774 n=1 Tax=Phymastichus coffea TaxID=108790 RepID=UPI00273B486C